METCQDNLPIDPDPSSPPTQLTEEEESSTFCLICCQNYPLNCFLSGDDSSSSTSFPPNAPAYLSKDLYVYFLLRHCLEVPGQRLQDYLRNCPRPEDWVRICKNCNEKYVEECAQIFWELLEVRRRFREARGRLIEVIKGAELENNEGDGGKERGDRFIFDISRETVRYVKKCKYKDLSEKQAFLEGDLLASEKEKVSSAVERKVASHFTCTEDEMNSSPEPNEDNALDVDLSLVKLEPDQAPLTAPTEEDDFAESASPAFDGDDDDPDFNVEEEEENYVPEPIDSDSDYEVEEPPKVKRGRGRSRKYPIGFKMTKPKEKPQSDKNVEVTTEIKVKRGRGRPRKHPVDPSKSNEAPLNDENKKGELEVGTDELKCSTCGKEYQSEKHMKEHYRKNHKNEGKFPCSLCDKKFSLQYRFSRHMNTVHGVFEFNKHFCSFKGCGKSFREKNMLERHEILHKPPALKCNICETLFRHKKGLVRHLKLHETKGELTPGVRQWSVVSNVVVKREESLDDQEGENSSAELNNDASMDSITDSESNDKNTKPIPSNSNDPEEQIGELTCKYCGKDYPHKKSLKDHTKRVHELEGKFPCHICGKTFGLRYRHLRHLNTVHSEVVDAAVQYTCSFDNCGKVFREKNLFDNHVRIHLPPQLSCEICGKMFRFRKHLNSHRRRHDSQGKRELACPHCSARYSFPDDLRQHIRVKHLEGGGSTTNRPRSARKPKQLFCSHCGKEFTETYRLNRHMSTVHKSKEHSKYTCSFEGCDKVFPDKSILERHEVMHKPPSRPCHICGRLFKRREHLNAHIRRHEVKGQKNFFCDQCPCAYGMKADLLAHQKLKHPEAVGYKVEVYTCHHCGVVRSDQRALRSHIRRVHEKKRICCEICGKMIQNTHMRHHKEAMHSIHRETKPHKCSVCGKGFSRREYLRGHRKTHLPLDQQPRRRRRPAVEERREDGEGVEGERTLGRILGQIFGPESS